MAGDLSFLFQTPVQNLQLCPTFLVNRAHKQCERYEHLDVNWYGFTNSKIVKKVGGQYSSQTAQQVRKMSCFNELVFGASYYWHRVLGFGEREWRAH